MGHHLPGAGGLPRSLWVALVAGSAATLRVQPGLLRIEMNALVTEFRRHRLHRRRRCKGHDDPLPTSRGMAEPLAAFLSWFASSQE
jgi:hypothetical protein